MKDEVKALYDCSPYPSSEVKFTKGFFELLNLYKIFSFENKLFSDNLNILDAGLGSGHRLAELIKSYPQHNYTGIDFSLRSIETAKKVISNITTSEVNILKRDLTESLQLKTKHDIIFCMGVLHHIEECEKALTNLAECLGENGVMFIYLYGEYGSKERLLNKELLKKLSKGLSQSDTLQMAKEMDFKMPYGWDHADKDDALYLDAFMHPFETFYNVEEIDLLVSKNKIHSYAINSIISEDKGYLFDASESKVKVPSLKTKFSKVSDNHELREHFLQLNIEERYAVIDLAYQPAAYTVVLFSQGAYNKLPEDCRLYKNIRKIK